MTECKCECERHERRLKFFEEERVREGVRTDIVCSALDEDLLPEVVIMKKAKRVLRKTVIGGTVIAGLGSVTASVGIRPDLLVSIGIRPDGIPDGIYLPLIVMAVLEGLLGMVLIRRAVKMEGMIKRRDFTFLE